MSEKKEYFTPDGRKIKGFFWAGGKKIPIVEKMNTKAEKLAKLLGIDLTQKHKIDEEVLIIQLDFLKKVSEEFPQVEKIMRQKYGHGLAVTVEPHGESKEDTASGYTSNEDGVIHLNGSVPPFDGDLEDAVTNSKKYGHKHKWGNSVLSTSEVGHTAVHEFAHLIQYALQYKMGTGVRDTQEEIMQIAMGEAGISEIPTNISVYANKGKETGNRSELISECIADAYFNKEKAHPLSVEIWKLCKRRLRGRS